MAMRTAACLSDMLSRQHAMWSARRSLTNFDARSSTYSSVPIGTLPTSPLYDADINAFDERISSAVATCHFGGSAMVLVVLITTPHTGGRKKLQQ